jgi:hypothetical protein
MKHLNTFNENEQSFKKIYVVCPFGLSGTNKIFGQPLSIGKMSEEEAHQFAKSFLHNDNYVIKEILVEE